MGMNVNFKLVETFEHVGRKCAIVESNIFNGTSYNGYVQIVGRLIEIMYFDSNVTEAELTFQGNLSMFGLEGVYVGFDTCHSYNLEHPHTRTLAFVREQVKKLAEELNLLDVRMEIIEPKLLEGVVEEDART